MIRIFYGESLHLYDSFVTESEKIRRQAYFCFLTLLMFDRDLIFKQPVLVFSI